MTIKLNVARLPGRQLIKINEKIYFREDNMKISADTQYVIRKYIKDKKYIIDSVTLKISFKNTVDIIVLLQREFNRTKDKGIKKAIDELRDNRFE